jgi:Zn-dependent M28 family amino/carboxypeptidase
MKKEYVAIGAHYDHVGYNKKHQEGEDYIFNGADDNASGTAGVLAVAKAFATQKTKPERSVIFILFAGEELGLYGSAYYCDHPLLPLDKTVVMLNMDMISRNGSDTLQLDGIAQNPDLSKILLKEAGRLKLRNFPSSEDLFKRSDHYNFFKKGISAMDITSGLHKDYHTVRDNPGSVDPEKAATISKMIFTTARTVANEKRYLKIVPLPK